MLSVAALYGSLFQVESWELGRPFQMLRYLFPRKGATQIFQTHHINPMEGFRNSGEPLLWP